MNNQERFMMLYGNNKQTATCNGSELLGASYVCPKPTIGGKGRSPFSKQNPKCGVPVPTQHSGLLTNATSKQNRNQERPTPDNESPNAGLGV